MIQQDEIIDEIRKQREAFAGAFDYDPQKIAEELRRQQEKSGRQVVSRPARKPVTSRVIS